MDARRKRKRIQRVRTVMLLLICIVQIIVMRQNGLDQIGIVYPILRHVQQQRTVDAVNRFRVRFPAQCAVDQHRRLCARDRGRRRYIFCLRAIRHQRLRSL